MRKMQGLCVLLASVGVGCAPDQTARAPAAPTDPEELADQLEGAPPDSLEAQVARGARIFDGDCDTCHGSRGQGRSGIVEVPQIIGPGVLASDQIGNQSFTNAQAVYDYVSTRMPRNRPGALEPNQYWDVVAYLLYASDVELEEPLKPANASDVVLSPAIAMKRAR